MNLIKQTTLLATVLFVTGTVNAENDLIVATENRQNCNELLEINDSKALIPQSHLNASKQLQFNEIKGRLRNQAANQDQIFVNDGKEQDIVLEGKKVYEVLRKFHASNGYFNKRTHKISFEFFLDYESTRTAVDPRNKRKLIQIHAFKKQVSKELAIYALLNERQSSKGQIFYELDIRLVNSLDNKFAVVELPLTYYAYGSYETRDKEMKLTDTGLQHFYHANLSFTDSPAQNGRSGVNATLKNSFKNNSIKDVLSIKMFVTR